MLTSKSMRISAVFLVAMYLPLGCFCAMAQAAEAASADAAVVEAESAGCGMERACHEGAAERSSDESHPADEGNGPCNSHHEGGCCAGGHGPVSTSEAAKVASKPLTLPGLDWTPLPAVMLPASLVERPTAVRRAMARDERPRSHCAPTLLSLACLLTI